MSNQTIFTKIDSINTDINADKNLLKQLLELRSNFEKNFQIDVNEHFSAIEKVLNDSIAEKKQSIEKLSQDFKLEDKLNVNEVIEAVLDTWNIRKVHKTIFEYNGDYPEGSTDETVEDSREMIDSYVEALKSIYNVNIEKEQVTYITLSVDTANRNELWLVRIFLAPGFSYGTLDTGKVGWDTDYLLNSQFLAKLLEEITA